MRGARKLALSLVSAPRVVGSPIVSIGIRGPEIAVSMSSALKIQVDLALGSVLGSTTFNIRGCRGLVVMRSGREIAR